MITVTFKSPEELQKYIKIVRERYEKEKQENDAKYGNALEEYNNLSFWKQCLFEEPCKNNVLRKMYEYRLLSKLNTLQTLEEINIFPCSYSE